MNNGNGRMNVGVIGVNGNVSILRKIPALLGTDLSENFSLVAGADIFSTKQMSAQNFLDNYRFKETIPLKARKMFLKEVMPNMVYFCVTKGNSFLPNKLLELIGENGVIDISTPNEFHLPFFKQAAIYHKGHVIVEKPVIRNSDEMDELASFIVREDLEQRAEKRVFFAADHYIHYGNIQYFVNNFRRLRNVLGRDIGKITGIDIKIEEDEDFANERNQNTIRVASSGGGIWLDTGIHALNFLRVMGLRIDYQSIEARPCKSNDPHIQSEVYGETSMKARFNLIPDEALANGRCSVQISVGKFGKEHKKQKRFDINYECGKASMNMLDKSLSVFGRDGRVIYFDSFSDDAFYNMYKEFYQRAKSGKGNLDSLVTGIANVNDVLAVYDRAKPLRMYNDRK